ncbi:hypothetical protein TVAG_034190 [Trichomonas vaginalis G3]|uniref:Right handed beta helix domain-containing protein n=1 Tax=Trichomonas vaginalis (strain ATCC PRA-98 / G3) TaxID=412133 RepID=A2EM56_TRIV3|nr:hypothetical protein TVAGG3_0641150 [Trichomonas vaginalis G3]EAY06240.1 hypothetical protein TVAG_034190 [Trichomonas vaginalis G3]KAI5505179.1 hypothetical protein TVAGG3_0641150 [Trichomonas vaginalis G3]|eukprot:XP_001318463.1 hypothetical protein [Trichomonas vaginalis G3]
MKISFCILNYFVVLIISNIFMFYRKMKHFLSFFFDSGPNMDIWRLFYENSVITENHTENKILNPTEVGNYYVTKCFFNGIENIVINIDIADHTKLLISISGFNGTKTPSQTVYSRFGSCIVYRICVTKSIQSSSNDGVFLKSTITYLKSKNKIIIEDSTVFDCGDMDKGGSINFLEYGNLSYSRNNITNNKCKDDVSLQIYSDQRYNISQSSFIDNKANSRCFYNLYSGPHQFYLCNIIRNNGNKCFNLWKVIVTFESCSIKNNNCPQTFYLYSSPNSATIINSDYDGQTTDNVEVQSPTNNIYNELSHLSTRLCEAKNKIENNFEEENDIKKFNNLKNLCTSVNFFRCQSHHILDISLISSYSIFSLIK